MAVLPLEVQGFGSAPCETSQRNHVIVPHQNPAPVTVVEMITHNSDSTFAALAPLAAVDWYRNSSIHVLPAEKRIGL